MAKIGDGSAMMKDAKVRRIVPEPLKIGQHSQQIPNQIRKKVKNRCLELQDLSLLWRYSKYLIMGWKCPRRCFNIPKNLKCFHLESMRLKSKTRKNFLCSGLVLIPT